MDFKNGVINIQATGYNGLRTGDFLKGGPTPFLNQVFSLLLMQNGQEAKLLPHH